MDTCLHRAPNQQTLQKAKPEVMKRSGKKNNIDLTTYSEPHTATNILPYPVFQSFNEYKQKETFLNNRFYKEKMELKLTPIEDRIIVRPDPTVEKTAAGIYIPDTAKEKPQIGTILAVGPGVYAKDTGVLIPMQVKAGMRVAYGKYSGTEMPYQDQDYLTMRQSDIYCIIEE